MGQLSVGFPSIYIYHITPEERQPVVGCSSLDACEALERFLEAPLKRHSLELKILGWKIKLSLELRRYQN